MAIKNCRCGRKLPKGNNTFCELCSVLPRVNGLPVLTKDIESKELKKLEFCNSDKLLNMIIQTQDGTFATWVGIFWHDTDDVDGKDIYRVTHGKG